MDKFLSELERASINIRGRISGYLTGDYKSNKLGDSYDFYGIRPYYQGDDIKNIHWKAFGRTEKVYTKLFTEQKQINATILLDNSKSMDFGQPSKWEDGKIYALGIGYIVLKELNKLNLYSFNESIQLNLNDLNGKRLFHYVLNEINNIQPNGGTNLKESISLIKGNKGIIFIITDLLSDEINKFLDNVAQKYERAVLIHVLSKEELNPEFKGKIKLIDKETGKYILQDINEREITIYKDKLKEFINSCREQCERRGIKYIFSQEDPSQIETILRAIEVE